jgi:hypothetical protein
MTAPKRGETHGLNATKTIIRLETQLAGKRAILKMWEDKFMDEPPNEEEKLYIQDLRDRCSRLSLRIGIAAPKNGNAAINLRNGHDKE